MREDRVLGHRPHLDPGSAPELARGGHEHAREREPDAGSMRASVASRAASRAASRFTTNSNASTRRQPWIGYGYLRTRRTSAMPLGGSKALHRQGKSLVRAAED